MNARDLNTLTTIVTAVVLLELALPILMTLGALLGSDTFNRVTEANFFAISAVLFGTALISVSAFCIWIHRAGSNLVAAGLQGLEFTPGARVWWFFVPIANLFRPFQGMRELWNASHGITDYQASSEQVSLWWSLWLIALVPDTLLMLFGMEGSFPTVTWLLFGAELASTLVAIRMIRAIAAAQAKLNDGSITEIFA